MPTRPLLYTYRRCPYAMRARMALLMGGVAFDAHEIVLRSKPPGLLHASPKGTVPVLVLPSGEVIDQSWDIVRWALTQAVSAEPLKSFWQRAQEAALQELLRLNDGVFKHHLDRYKYPERFRNPDGDNTAGAREGHRQAALDSFLVQLEQRLSAGPFLGGGEPCATDIGVFPFVRQFAAVEPSWFDSAPLPQVRQWLAHWLQSPLFEACMHKLPSDRPVAFGPAA